MRYQWTQQIGNHWIGGTDSDICLSFDSRPVLGIAIQKVDRAAVMARKKLTLGGIPCITDGKLRQDLFGMPEQTRGHSCQRSQ